MGIHFHMSRLCTEPRFEEESKENRVVVFRELGFVPRSQVLFLKSPPLIK